MGGVVFGRVGLAVLLTAVAAIAASALSAHARPARPPTAGGGGELEEIGATRCGVERWPVKTLTDAAARTVRFVPHPSSVDSLRSLPNPGAGFATPRLPGPEKTTYRLTVRLVQAKRELDRDIHLVVASPRTGKTMIVELPSSTCTRGARDRYAMAQARARFVARCGTPAATSWRRLAGRAVITGVAFFDVLHGQHGVAPNGIELHPVIGFRATRC